MKKIQNQPIKLDRLEKLSQEIADILKKANIYQISETEKSGLEYICAIIESKKLLHSEYLHINTTRYTEIRNTFQRKSHITLNKKK